MLRKRLIAMVTVRDGLAVQSFGYRKHLPIGKPEIVVENLDRWGADEIVVNCIDRDEPDLRLLDSISRRGLSTPLIYGGGIRSVLDAVAVVAAGADRICLDALLREDPTVVGTISTKLGAQAIIGVLPLQLRAGKVEWLNHRTMTSTKLDPRITTLFRDAVVSEALVVDWNNEGSQGNFDLQLLRIDELRDITTIAFGGLSNASIISAALQHPRVSAVAVGNTLAYREHAIQHLKSDLTGALIRPPIYSQEG